jgi:hypothetical protein
MEGKSYELDYKMKHVAEYQKLKEQGMPDDRIACFHPEMKGLLMFSTVNNPPVLK